MKKGKLKPWKGIFGCKTDKHDGLTLPFGSPPKRKVILPVSGGEASFHYECLDNFHRRIFPKVIFVGFIGSFFAFVGAQWLAILIVNISLIILAFSYYSKVKELELMLFDK